MDHLVISMCRVFSCVVGRGCLLWPVCSLGKTLLTFALLHFVLQGQICLLFQVSLDFLLLHSSPLLWKGHLLGASYYIDCSKCITCNDSLVIDPPLIWSFLPEKTLSFSFWGLWHLFLSPCQCFWSKEEEECWRQLSLVFLIPLLGATDFLCG